MPNAEESLYSFIENLREDCSGLKNIDDVDVFCSQNNIDIKKHTFASSGFCGVAFIGTKQDTIVLNLCRNDKERFFDFIHELIHTRKHRNIGKVEFTCLDLNRKQDSFIEWEANEGAAEFIMPYKEVLPFIKNKIKNYDNSSSYHIRSLIDDLSSKYGVSFTVAQYRISGLCYEIWQYLNGVSIDKIEILSHNEQIRRNIHIESLSDIEGKMLNETWISNTRKNLIYYSNSYKLALT